MDSKYFDRSPTTKSFEQEKKEVKERFENEYNVDPDRLRFFRTKGKFYDAVHEIWLVRSQKSRKNDPLKSL